MCVQLSTINGNKNIPKYGQLFRIDDNCNSNIIWPYKNNYVDIEELKNEVIIENVKYVHI